MEYGFLIFVHVVSGALWACIAWFFALFVAPAVSEAGPGGGAVMAGLIKRKVPQLMFVFSTLAVLSGLRLYWIRYSGSLPWNAEHIVLTLGSLMALHAYAKGLLVSRPLAEKAAALGAQLAQSPGDEALQAELKAAQAKMAQAGRSTAYLALGILLLMAGHRLAALF